MADLTPEDARMTLNDVKDELMDAVIKGYEDAIKRSQSSITDLTPEVARMTLNNAKDSIIEAIVHGYDITVNNSHKSLIKYNPEDPIEEITKKQPTSADKFPIKVSDLERFFSRIDSLIKKKNQPDKIILYKPSTDKVVIKGGKASNNLTEKSVRYNDKEYLFAIDLSDLDKWMSFQKLVEDNDAYNLPTDSDD